MSIPTLGYWDIRGLAQANRLLLEYLGVKYEDKRYSDNDSWQADKFNLGLRFPNIPYFIDGQVKLTESKAVLKYIARTRGPQLVPTDAYALALAEEIEGVGSDLQKVLIDVSYGQSKYEAVKDGIEKKLEYLNAFLGQRKYVVGDKLTFIDFFLYEVLYQYGKFGEAIKNAVLKPYPNLTSYVSQFESLPELKNYIQSTAKNPVFSAGATILY